MFPGYREETESLTRLCEVKFTGNVCFKSTAGRAPLEYQNLSKSEHLKTYQSKNMNSMETTIVPENLPETDTNTLPVMPVATAPAEFEQAESITAQGCGCGNKGGKASEPAAAQPSHPNYIYALGQIRSMFPSLDVEKEFRQAIKDGQTANLTDQQAIYEILKQKENRYLAEDLCWVLSIGNIDTYLLQPVGEHVIDQFIEGIKPVKTIDCDAIIGFRGPIAPPDACNGLQLPIVGVKKIYSFEVGDFVKAMPKAKGVNDQAIQELFTRIQQMVDNAGNSDEHRALNYLALRYPNIYTKTAEMFAANKSLEGVEVQPARLGGSRKIVQVIFSFVDRSTDVKERFFVKVDVTGQYPFLTSQLQPYYSLY